MSFFDNIEKLKKKDERAKKRILFMILSMSMAVLIFIWLNNFRLKFSQNANTLGAPSPFNLIWNTLKANIQDFKQNIIK